MDNHATNGSNSTNHIVEGFSLERTEADTAMEVGVTGDEPRQETEEQTTAMLDAVIGEDARKTYTENPEFLLNPAKMTTQGQIVFYMNVLVAFLVVVSTLLAGKLNLGALLLVLNIVIMAFLHANVINCMIVGNCNAYSTILTILNVVGQVFLVIALIYMMVSKK
jgi:hypothetical protein